MKRWFYTQPAKLLINRSLEGKKASNRFFCICFQKLIVSPLRGFLYKGS